MSTNKLSATAKISAYLLIILIILGVATCFSSLGSTRGLSSGNTYKGSSFSSQDKNSDGDDMPQSLPRARGNSDERRRQIIIKDFRLWLQGMEEQRICDRSEAVVEVPISPILRDKLRIPSEQTTRTVDIKYVVIAPPSDAEKEDVINQLSTLAEGDNATLDLAESLSHIADQFLNYPKNYKLLVLSKARDSFGKYNLTAYNAEKIFEFDDGGGFQLSAEDVETSFEDHDTAYDALTRYGHCFLISE